MAAVNKILTDWIYPIYGGHFGLFQIFKANSASVTTWNGLESVLRQSVDSFSIQQVRIDTNERTDEMSFAKIGLFPIFKGLKQSGKKQWWFFCSMKICTPCI